MAFLNTILQKQLEEHLEMVYIPPILPITIILPLLVWDCIAMAVEAVFLNDLTQD
jgi:hypothetical protein